jgi:hypothetical protein
VGWNSQGLGEAPELADFGEFALTGFNAGESAGRIPDQFAGSDEAELPGGARPAASARTPPGFGMTRLEPIWHTSRR